MDRETIDMEITPRERSQLLRYGYPFLRIKAALEAHSASKRTEVVPLDRFELERLIGDLSYTINHMNPARFKTNSSCSAIGSKLPSDTATACSIRSEPRTQDPPPRSKILHACRKDTYFFCRTAVGREPQRAQMRVSVRC